MSQTLPEITLRELEGEFKATLSLRLPPGLLYFEGHFPGSPILPGVAQVEWAQRYAREFFKIPGEFKGLEALKFQLPLLPGDACALELEHRPQKNAAYFSFRSEKGRHSSGRLLYG